MGYDKVVDSVQLDNDLTSIAEAIRSKSGADEGLEFPSGFVSEINTLGGATGTYNMTRSCYGTLQEKTWTRPSGWPNLDSLNLTMF